MPKASIAIHETKIKPKTRSNAKAFEDAAGVDPEQDVIASQEAIIKVLLKPSNIASLSQLFPTGVATSAKIQWQALVDAIADAGFNSTHGSGSAVIIKDSNSNRGAIVFHRPHSETTIAPVLWKDMGNRMGKWFDRFQNAQSHLSSTLQYVYSSRTFAMQ